MSADFWLKGFEAGWPSESLKVAWSAGRTAIAYLFAVGIVRIGALRLIGRLSTLDVLVGFTLGSLLSRGMTGSASLAATAAASVSLIGVHWLASALAYHSHRWGKLMKRDPVLLVKDGRLLPDNMAKAKISEHDVMEGLRLRGGLSSLQDVREVFLERNGELSIVPYRR